MVEYSLKVKSNGSDASEKDDELIDGCFEVKQTPCSDIQLRNVRLFSLLGPIDVRFAILRYAVEATIDIEVKKAIAGYNLSTVTASTCGYEDEIMLYDSSAPCPMAALNYGSSSLMAVASAVVAVELGCNLKLRIGIATGEEFGPGRHVRKSFHDLFFATQKHNTTEELVVIDSIFEVAVKVTWSTMGKHFHPFFHSNRSLLGENPHGPCFN
jgi:hypothetical protein